jgi:uncharacterized protein (DUF697 family)
MSFENDDVEVQGQRLLSAVEHLVSDPDTLIAEVEALAESVKPGDGVRDPALLDVMSRRLIATFSNRSAIAGGLTALPATLPGVGTVVTITGGALVDMALMLRHEVELAMCLTHLYGYDIRDEKQRWLAYLLAGASTYEAKSGRNYFVDLADAQLEAMTLYTPRQLSKIMATVLGKLALLSVSRGFVKGLPFVGIVVGLSANKLLTTNVGWRCVEALERRQNGVHREDEEVVDATVQGAVSAEVEGEPVVAQEAAAKERKKREGSRKDKEGAAPEAAPAEPEGPAAEEEPS